MFDYVAGLALLAIAAVLGYAAGKQAGLDEAGSRRYWREKR